ncbi:DDE family transposase [Paracoccus lutimaris]|uniref:DDE family transposase n=1 Tax=Paracoccus lutimaris TaxID=1490030 RepID=A0A368YV84_9RHOB|nr:DDE family transposase [Paracoccus lutimaris]
MKQGPENAKTNPDGDLAWIRPCIPGRRSRRKAVCYDKRRYKRRNRIEIMFGRLKDWRRIATPYDRCAKTFLSALALAATVMFWL